MRVWVKNTNQPEPSSDDHFSGSCTLQYNGELYDFPPGKGVLVSPEHAFWQWLWDCRSDVNERGEIQSPRNYRDRMTTGAIGNSGIGNQITLYEAKKASLGWLGKKAHRFENWEFASVDLKQVISGADFDKLSKAKM